MSDSRTGSNTSKVFVDITRIDIMDACSVGGTGDKICWFCKKGRHSECMKEIPTDAMSDGPHDCTFDTKMVPCQCQH
ncbi:MAG: hypothetical protein EB163_04875 [Nitrososphaeria archaeon]|nr:hypothetical protein [Nitrososphaeria archaeon]NDB52208.1 hypothetical protein [Nitrosopumilaceae archaeon]